MDTKPVERKWALTKIKAGDWLLVGNDGKTLWRIATYEEGESHGVEGMPDKTFWGVWKWPRPVGGALDMDALEDWSGWDMDEGWLKTREAAIQSALRAELWRPKPTARRGKLSVQEAIQSMAAQT